MRTVSALFASLFLFLTVASLALPTGVGALFALLLFFALFVLALLGVFTGMEERTVRQHDPSMDGREWRDGVRRREVPPVAAPVDRPAPYGVRLPPRRWRPGRVGVRSRAREIAAHAGTTVSDAPERAAERQA